MGSNHVDTPHFLCRSDQENSRESKAICRILLVETRPSLVPVSTIKGMQAILNQSTIRLLSRKLADGQFNRLIDWLDGIDCYRLNMTSDLNRVNALVEDLV